MAGMVIISFLVLMKFNFNIGAMFTEVKTATSHGADYLNPGIKYKNPLGTLSLMLALVLGTAGLPHILMRFFTVKDAKTARSSVITATWTIGIFYILTLFLGFGAAIYVGESEILAANPGGNMAAPLLAQAIGGNILFAFISAVAFATILAVVAGLVLSGASAFAHDIYGQIIKKGEDNRERANESSTLCSIRCICCIHPIIIRCSILKRSLPRFFSILYCSKCEFTSYFIHGILEAL